MGQQEARTYHTCWIHPGPKLDSPHPSCQHPRSQRSASGTWPSTSTTKPAEETSGPSASLPTSQARKSEKCTFQPSPQQHSRARHLICPPSCQPLQLSKSILLAVQATATPPGDLSAQPASPPSARHALLPGWLPGSVAARHAITSTQVLMLLQSPAPVCVLLSTPAPAAA
ncbi:uncharacterized protein LOC144335222 isoform X1 [Macaca mulatta]